MDRSQRMAQLARDLRTEPSQSATFDLVAEVAKNLLDATHAGISIINRDGTITMAAATSQVPRRHDELQEEFGEGPCVEAASRREHVIVADVASEQRWPRWTARAVQELHVGSMMGLQLFTNEEQFGALNLFFDAPHAFDSTTVDEAIAISAHAAVALASAGQVESLQIALDRRTVIGEAIGIIMERHDLSATVAFDFLRRVSSQENRKIYDLAIEMVS